MEILFKTETLEQRLFYIQKSAEFNWNKYELRDQLKKDLYGHQSLMPNNFLKSLPKHSQALKAIEMFKDEYLLDYLHAGHLALHKGNKEKAMDYYRQAFDLSTNKPFLHDMFRFEKREMVRMYDFDESALNEVEEQIKDL